MKVVTTQHETREIVTSTHSNVAELRDLIFQLLASKLEIEQITALTSRDPGLASKLMEAGQKVYPDPLVPSILD